MTPFSFKFVENSTISIVAPFKVPNVKVDGNETEYVDPGVLAITIVEGVPELLFTSRAPPDAVLVKPVLEITILPSSDPAAKSPKLNVLALAMVKGCTTEATALNVPVA